MKKFLTILTASILMIVSVFAIGCNFTEISEQNKTSSGAHVYSVRMAMGAPMSSTSSNGEQYIEKTLSATVLPISAYNRKVDFIVEWDEGATLASEPVSDYIKVVPTSDGSETAKVRCFKSFGDDKIIITVKTRDGGLTDTCTVSFMGFCSDIELDTSSLTKNLGVTNHTGEYILFPNNSYTIPIITSNIFNDVTASLKIQDYGWRGVLLDGFFNEHELTWATDGYIELFDVNIVESNLVINTKETSLSSGAKLRIRMLDDKPIIMGLAKKDTDTHLFIIVEDEITGVTQELKFWIEAGVDSVTLDNKNLIFWQ